MRTCRPTRPARVAALPVFVGAILLAAGGAWGYIDLAPEQFTLPRLLLEFRSAGLYEVERVDLEKGAVRFRPLEPIQGLAPTESLNHTIGYDGHVVPELKNIQVGQKAVLFRDDPYARAVTMIEGTWYVSGWDRATGWARLATLANPFFECGFCGTVPELVAACKALVRGETIVVRCRPKPKAAETQWVTTSLREPHKRSVVPAPAGAPADPPKPAPAEALPALLERLRAEKPDVRMDAAAAIGRLGPQAKAAAPALLAAFPQEKDPFARRAMIIALGAIGPDAREALPALAAALRDGYGSVDDLVGFEAAAALMKVDPDGTASGQCVLAMLRDKNPDVRCRAASLVRLLGPGLKSVAPALAEATKDAHAGVRLEALRSLVALKAEAGLMLPLLTAAIGDSEKYVRMHAAQGLAGYGPEAKGATKTLIDAVAKEKDPEVRSQEIRALRYIGPAAVEAVPMLMEAAKDPNEQVRTQAEKAIKKIRPEPPPTSPTSSR